MKVLITYPPIPSPKGTPLLAQNRQFQYFTDPTYIFPVIPSYMATMLRQEGFDTYFLDGIALELNYQEWFNRTINISPEIIIIETKTPAAEFHYQVINELKSKITACRIILFGDHATARPREAFERSGVDIVAAGGHADFIVRDFLLRLREKKGRGTEDFLLQVSDLTPGIILRTSGGIIGPVKMHAQVNLDTTPFINRDLVNYRLYACKNGNFKRTPGTYMMSGRDCHWHKCTFCSWTTLFPYYSVMSVKRALDEYEHCVSRYGIREIMDDSGSFPPGKWAADFAHGIIERNLHKKIYIDANLRFGQFTYEEYRLLKKANFRFMLFGLESASDTTLRKIQKGVTRELIESSIKDARRAGLFPHITVMFGYPWENEQEINETVRFVKKLMLGGYAYTVQATLVIPYPGTPLYDECEKSGILKNIPYSEYDMRTPVMKTSVPEASVFKAISSVYRTGFHPLFLLRKIAGVRDLADVAYFYRIFKKVLRGHLRDFSERR